MASASDCASLFVYLRQIEAPDAVTVAEQSHVVADGVDDQIGEVLLLVPSPGVTAPRLILQKRNESVNSTFAKKEV